jgi:hypothetical protein
MYCLKCSAKYAVGLFRCPQCQSVSELFAKDSEPEVTVPKVSVSGGSSNAEEVVVEDPSDVAPVADAVPAAVPEEGPVAEDVPGDVPDVAPADDVPGDPAASAGSTSKRKGKTTGA